MISADFYSTAVQFDAPTYPPTFHLTNDIRTCDANAFSTFYWLGWLAWDNFPDCWKLSEYVLTNTDLSFTIATQPQNINIGYASIYDNSQNTGSVKYPECYHESPLVNISQSYARYINKLDVMGVGSSGVRFGWHCSYIYGTGDSLTNRSYNDGTFTKSGKALYDFLYGEDTQTIQLVTGISYELDFDNMEEDGSFHFTTTYNDNNYDFVISFSYCAVLNMQNVSTTAVASTRNVNAYPMYSLTMDDDTYSFISTGSCFYQPAGYPACIINKQTQQPIVTPSAGNIIGDYIANGLVCDIPKAFITSSPSYSRLITGNAHVFNRGSDIAVYRMLTRSEMQKIVGLSLRQSDGTYNTYGYQNELSYAPYITEDNEFTATLITGDLSDDEFKAKLRQWQYDENEWEENTYTESDLPPYDGGDDETDSGGDDIRADDWDFTPVSAANNFITLYGLNYKTLSDFGQKMWASLADPEFWQMVGTAFTNDFSINPADMMKYFVSLRFFPFDLSTLSNTLASGIYIGRAATPITPSTGQDIPYPIRLSNNIAQLSGGRLTIRRYYNDFRDYEPCTTVQIHVPFCGSVDVPASEVMGHEMDLTYKIDLQTGAMLAVLGVASNTYYVIATLAGTCGASIPITANNNIEFLQRIATVGSGLIGGGVSGAVKGATVGGEVGAVVGAVAGTVGGGVGALAGLPPVTVHKQGNASGFANLGGVPYAYATVQRGRFERPANYGHTTGFACDFSATLGSLSGFTVCDNVDTSGLTCNADERDEIKRLLESGVYV